MTSAYATPTSQPIANLKSRSMGNKFFLVLLLAVARSIPGLFVSNMTDNRAESRGATATWQDGALVQPHTVLGVRMADSYRSVNRSLKYITLFLGLVFLTYFLFEVTTGTRVHPAQYALVGVAQIIFYLLLLSLAEHLGFDLAFLIAGAATVALFSINTEWVFASRRQAYRAFAVFSLLYAFIYVLLRLEDYALLVGASASFAAVAASMYFTRHIDWYSAGKVPAVAAGPMGGAATMGRGSILD